MKQLAFSPPRTQHLGMTIAERHEIAYLIVALVAIGVIAVLLRLRRVRRRERRSSRAPIDIGIPRDDR